MKILIKVWIFSSLLLSKSPDFRINQYIDCQDCIDRSLSYSAFWLSESPIINPLYNGKVFIQYGLSNIYKNKINENWQYPNLNISVKMTKNLAITSKIYGFRGGEDSPQVLGAGIQYFGGKEDSLTSIFVIQRTDLKGLKDFTLSSLNFELKRWTNWNLFNFRYGIGSVFYKNKINVVSEKIKSVSDGQINFFELEVLYSIYKINLGGGIRINNKLSIYTFLMQKELF